MDMNDTMGMHRNPDHHTSIKAAASILPKRFTIRQQVEEFAKGCGAAGFTDEQLEAEFPHWAASSWRTRRSELAQENVILDTGTTRNNAAGREMIVWLHRDLHPSPPPIVERQQPLSRADRIVRLNAMVNDLTDMVAMALPYVEDALDDHHFSHAGKERIGQLIQRMRNAAEGRTTNGAN